MIQRLAEIALAAALHAGDPAAAVRRGFARKDEGRPIRRLAIGKAAPAMLLAAREADSRTCRAELAIVHESWADGAARVIEGSHPYMDERSLLAGDAALSFVQSMQPEEALVALVSGGASAMAATPWPSIDPGAYGRALRGLIDQGTPIAELNCVRRHCERLKGGGMAHECGAGAIEVLVLSDVIGDDLATVASGPFAPDATTNVDAAEILMKRLGGEGATVAQVLQRPEHPETLKVPDPRVSHTILASNEMVIQAVAAAIRETVDVTLVRTGLTGDVADVVDRLDGDASFVRMGSEPRAMVFGGEYTVDASTCRGIGGPSQELALHLAEIMMNETHPWSRHAHWGVWTLSTDGRDGPSEGSGALLSDAMMPNAAESRASIARALHHHDSSAYLRGVGGLIPRRSTGTNLNHVGILAAW